MTWHQAKQRQGRRRRAPRLRLRLPAARKLKHQHDPETIRIVPLHVAGDAELPTPEALAAGPAAVPHLTYRGGPLLTSVKVFTIFWGAAWTGAQAGLVTKSMRSLLCLDEPAHRPAERIQRSGSDDWPWIAHRLDDHRTPPARSVTDAALQTFLKNEIANNKTFPKPDTNTLYFLLVPPGVRIVQGGSASCKAFCGYHNDIGGSIFYAVMPYPGCAGCLGTLSSADALTSTSSHELCEAITDAVPGPGDMTTRTAKSGTSARGRRRR